MLISIITATYNNEHTLSNTVLSIQSQVYKDIEFTVVDGGSTDYTLSILRNYDGYISKLISEPDEGIYDALNKGIDRATGDIICFLHADDLFATENVLNKVIGEFESKNVEAVYGDMQYVSFDNPNKIIRQWKSGKFSLRKLVNGWMPPHPTLFLKRSVYEKHGLFDLDFKISADYDFILRIFSDPTLKFAYIPEVLVKMRLGGMSNRSLKNIIQKSREDYRALKKNNIPYPVWVLFLKNVRKILQFFVR